MTRLLQRQILPIDRDTDVFPLYVDLEDAKLDTDRLRGRRQQVRQGPQQRRDPPVDLDRPQAAPRPDPFPYGAAARSRRSCCPSAPTSTPSRRPTGAGTPSSPTSSSPSTSAAPARPSRSTSRWRAATRSASTPAAVEGDSGSFTFKLPLKPFVDGGWYWYDVVAGDHGCTVESAEWTAQVPADRAEHGTVDVCITTMLPDMSAQLLGQLGNAEELQPYLDTVFVMDQGKDKVTDSEYFPAAEAGLGDKLRVIVQGNLGGSGGYARGQLESVRKGTATYAMMMDDDVVCEPEGIIRAVTFGDLAKRPTLVGGHMFNLYSRSQMHSFGEIVQPWRFWWQTRLDGYAQWDFGARNLRSSRWLHKRADVDFNGWFMCLIPRVVLEEVGLSLPVFIKWDDSEFGLRAKAAGYPTVSFPGAAVWHVPWTDKNDGVDWQSYFHHRNRIIAALLHSPYERGGRMVRESLNHQVKHLASLQYSTAELRHLAMEDVLRGPHALHGELATKLADINAFRKQFTDAQLHRGPRQPAPGAPQEAAEEGQVRHRDPGSLGHADRGRPRRRCASCARCARCRRSSPRPSSPRWTPAWYNLVEVRLGRGLDERRHVGRPLQARPGPLPRPAQAHDRDPPALPPRVAGARPAVPRRPAGDHLARGVGQDLRALRGQRGAGPPDENGEDA